MKILFTLALLTTVSTAAAQSLEITIPNVRSDKGSILVMTVVTGAEKPVYGKADAKQGMVVVLLEGIDADTAEVSLFHDENGNFQMDMGDRGPTEGYATRKCKLQEEKTGVKMNLFYPAATE